MTSRTDPQPPDPPDRTRSFVEAGGVGVDSAASTRLKVLADASVSTDAAGPTPTPFHRNLPPKYQFVRTLGRGGMGEVVLAFEPALRRYVALKFMLRKAAASPFARQRFVKEARVLAQLDHPNVVKVHGWEEFEGEPYFVMAYLDGHPLHERREEFRTSAARAVGVIAELAAGLQHVHANGVYHRDLKASNVVFSGGRPVITDFGCAKYDDGEHSTQGYALLGTPSHMAPEVLEQGSKEHDARADLWSLGVMLYHLLAGELPFAGDPRSGTDRTRLLTEDPSRLRECAKCVPGVDDRLEGIVRKALAKNPDERHQTAAEFASELQAWLASPPPEPSEPPLTPKPARRRRWAVGVGLAVVLLAACGVATLAHFPKSDQTRSLVDRIEAGEEVTLVGSNGMPVQPYQRVAGFTEGSMEVNAEGFCEASAARVAMFDFADVPLPLPVRLTVEVSHTAENVGSKVGIYAGRKTHPQANGKGVCHAAAVNWFTAAPFPPLNADKNGTASFALYWIAPGDQTSDFFTPCTHPTPLAVQRQPLPVPGGEPQFRTLTIDLYPMTAAATHDGAEVVNPLNLPRSLAVMRTMIGGRNEAYSEPVLPGNGFGLIVIQGSAMVRHATLRRLPQ